ncbi:hypothetical protein KSS87_006722 [Heliosperma pusillum]|nr:hypothetical protein KSS87_006722 [Heliosperma pusillum]
MKGWERAESSARGGTYPSLNKHKMLDGGHLDLNCIHFCSDSLKERLKQMMLKQENVFMGQVFELHRLYKIQTAMSEEFKQRGLSNYNSNVAGVSSSAVNLNNQIKSPMNDLQIRAPGFKQKPLDLQLSADDFIRQSANEIPGKEALRGFPIDLNNSFQDAVAFDLNRSLTIDDGISNRGVGHRSWMGKRIGGSPLDIVGVKDTNPSLTNNNVDFRIASDSSIPKSYLKDQHKLERSVLIDKHNSQSFSRSRTSRVYHGTTSSRPFNDAGLTSNRQTLCKTGFNADFLAADTSVSRGAIKLDLNTVALEDFSYISNTTSGVFNPVATSMSTMTHKVNSYAEIPPVQFRNYEGKLSGDSKPEVNGGNIIFIDLDSDSGEYICNSSEPKIESVGSTSKLSNDLSCEMEIEKVPNPAMLSHISRNSMLSEELSGLKLSNSSESKCSIKTMQSGVNGIDSNLTSSNESQMVDLGPERDHSGVPEQKSYESRDLNIHCINSKEAADLLMQISLERQPEYLGGLVKLNSKLPESKEEDGPQCSSESYEAMVLNAKEWGSEDYCVSSNAFVVDEPEKRDSRYKLKRGTRMKDFQKDILSSLSTLSRHEIREDINIFEGIIKSREYKITRAKVIDEGTWCRSTRRKRSRFGRR